MNASKTDNPLAPLLNLRTLRMAVIGVILGISLALVSHFLREPLYMSTLVLRVGEVGYVTNAGLVQRKVERPHEMVERLRYEHRLKGNSKGRAKLPRINRARLSRTDKNLVILEAIGKTPDQANSYLSALGEKLINDHQVHFSDAGDLWEKRHQQLRKHVTIIDGVIDKQLVALKGAPTESDQVHAVRLMQMGILTSHRAKADEDLHLLNVSRSRIYTRPTVMLQKPINARRVGLSMMATITVGGLAGGGLSTLLALIPWGRIRES